MKVILIESKDKRHNLDAVLTVANDVDEAELLLIKVCKDKKLEFDKKYTTRVLVNAEGSYKKPQVIYTLVQNNPLKPKKTTNKTKVDAETTESDK